MFDAVKRAPLCPPSPRLPLFLPLPFRGFDDATAGSTICATVWTNCKRSANRCNSRDAAGDGAAYAAKPSSAARTDRRGWTRLRRIAAPATGGLSLPASAATARRAAIERLIFPVVLFADALPLGVADFPGRLAAGPLLAGIGLLARGGIALRGAMQIGIHGRAGIILTAGRRRLLQRLAGPRCVAWRRGRLLARRRRLLLGLRRAAFLMGRLRGLRHRGRRRCRRLRWLGCLRR